MINFLNFSAAVFALFLFSIFTHTAHAQSGLAPTARPGLTIHVAEAGQSRYLPLVGAQVLLIMGKDTVKMKSDHKGEAYYRGKYRNEILKIIASHPGFETKIDSLQAPVSSTKILGIQLQLKRVKQESHDNGKIQR